MVAAAQIQVYDDVRVLRRVVTALVHDLEAQVVKGTVRKFHTGSRFMEPSQLTVIIYFKWFLFCSICGHYGQFGGHLDYIKFFFLLHF